MVKFQSKTCDNWEKIAALVCRVTMMLETAGKSTSSKVIKGGWLRDALKVKRAVGKLSEELHQSMQV